MSTEPHPTSVCWQRQNLWECGTAKQPVDNKLDHISNQNEAESYYNFDWQLVIASLRGSVVVLLDSLERGVGSSTARVIVLCSWARQFTTHHASVPTPPSFINGYAQDEKIIIRKLKHGRNMWLHCGNTRGKCVFLLLDTLQFSMFLLLLLQRNQNTFLHVSNRFPFQESLFPKSLTCVYVAEMQNSIPENCCLVPSSADEFNATVDVTLRSTGQHPIGWGKWGRVGTFRHRNILCHWSGTETGLSSSMMSLLAQYLTLITNP